MSFISCKTFTPRYKDTNGYTKELIFDKSFKFASDLNKIAILDCNLKGDVLEINVKYSGGCEDHSFNLVFDEMWKKSMPPKVSLYLEHKDGDDLCKSNIKKTVRFNIKKLKKHYNEVHINLVGYSKSINY
jgi:hypothetical protein|tara:strand:+ start:141 stop:530 length:390 start_codon:yes stop_codon:yes gene_type:complete